MKTPIPPRPRDLPYVPDDGPPSLGAMEVSVENLRTRIQNARACGLFERAAPDLLEDAVILIGGLMRYVKSVADGVTR